MRKRLLSIAMALCMVLTLLPATALADENPETPVCNCEEACTAEAMNTECAVCGAEGAAVESCCKYAAPAKEEPEEPVKQPEAPTCTCEEACTAEAMNTECAVCGAEGASVEKCCKYVAPAKEELEPEPELTAVEKVQAMIDALPTVEDLEDADDEKVDEVYAAVQDVYDALDELSTEELDQITGLDKLPALLEWFTGPVSTYEGEDYSYLNYTEVGETITITGLKNASVTEVIIPSKIVDKTVTAIENRAFFGCTSITSVAILGSVTSIGSQAFSCCTSLESVTFGEGSKLTSIGEKAFENCTKLKSINIPDSVTSIGNKAFIDCKSLTSINIPGGVTSIGDLAFDSCTSLTSITVDKSNNNYSSVDGVLYNKDKTVLIKYPEGKFVASYSIPDSVTFIGNNAFSGCTNLENITIPYGVISIGNAAFYKSKSLKIITFREDSELESIGSSAFRDCTSLTSIDIPDGVASIGYNAFTGCTSLESIDIPNSVTSIGYTAFSGCTSLTSIDIPNGVTVIGNLTFSKCTRLTSIEIPGNVSSIGDEAFGGCTSLESIFLPDKDNLTIGKNAIPATTSQVKYSLDTEKGEVTITEITLGTDKTGVIIPATICGYPVVAVAESEQSKVGEHKCAGDTATCINPKTCSLCGKSFSPHSYTKENTTIEGALKTAGTCKTEAVYYYSCINCDLVEKDDSHTFTGSLDSDNHTGTKVWKTTETQHKQYWDCCDAVVVYDQDHTWNNGVCSVCDYICTHKDTDKNHLCDICGVTLSEHSLEKVPAKAATVTETGNKEYWHCKDCGKYFADENGTNEIADLEAWKTGDGSIAKLPPEIIKGKGQSVAEGEKKALSFTSNAAFDDFICVELDGKTLDEKNYTVKEGSTIVALKSAYVATLSAGKHTIGIVSESGTATTTFTVKEKTAADNDTKAPETGDNSRMALWIALLLISGGLLTVMEICGKKKKYNR